MSRPRWIRVSLSSLASGLLELRLAKRTSGRYDGEVLGAMAQLVARLVRNEKVGGSNPPSSTTWVGLIARPFVYLLFFWA